MTNQENIPIISACRRLISLMHKGQQKIIFKKGDPSLGEINEQNL